jgi:uncharacterized protein (TIGR04141 family)
MAPIKISLSIYLLKTTALGEVQNLFAGRNATQLTNGLDGQFIDFPSPSNPPNWFRAVSGHLAKPSAFNIRGQSTAGMILIPRKKRHFVISFGHAWQYLKPSWLEPVVTSLDNLLDADLKSGQAKKDAVLIAPSFRRGDATSADSFAFGRRVGNPALAPYLSFGSWEYHLQKNKGTPTLDLAKSTSVHMFDAAGEIFESRKVYECLGYEVSLNGKPHILSSGVWYAADATFTAEIDTLLGAISAPTFALPVWDGKQREDDYNDKCCVKGSGRLLMDKKLVHYGGAQSKFEFCDFMDIKNRILFFAKHPSTSAACSHFVEQVNRTIDLLFSSDGTFRSKLKRTIIKNHAGAPVAWLDQPEARRMANVLGGTRPKEGKTPAICEV